MSLVTKIFWEGNRRNILAIPLKREMDDFVACHFSTRGIYLLVKSTYHVMLADLDLLGNLGFVIFHHVYGVSIV